MTTTVKADELNEIVRQYAAIEKEEQELKQKNEALPQERREERDRLHSRALKLRDEIEEDKATDRRKDFADLTNFLNAPVYKAPRGVEGEDDDRKMLSDIGWDCKSGIILAPTSLGKTVEMFDEEVLIGPLPDDDPAARTYFQAMRATFAPAYRKAYTKWLRNATKFRSEAMAYNSLSPEEQKALSEGTDTAGGFLVPPDVQAEILVRLPQTSVMRRLARVATTSRDKLVWPRVQAHATSGSIYSSGFVGGWVGETPAFSDTDPAFGTFDIAIKKARVATKLGNDFLSDAAANVLAFLAQNGAENMGLVEDNGFFTGDGTALVPTGVLNGGSATVDVEGSTADTISNTTSATGSAPKLIDLVYTLPSQYTERAVWVMRRAIEGKIRKLVDAQGRFLWPPLTGSGFAAAPREIMGYPVYNSEFVPADGTNANKVLIFGDLSAYIIAQRAQITTVVLRERFADTDQTGIILFERVGGAIWNEDALRFGVV